MPERIGIIGLGLLGTSLAMALAGRRMHRIGWTRNPAVRRKLLETGVIDGSADDVAVLLPEMELTVLAMPIPAILDFMERYGSCWRPGAVVCDVGSVKSPIMKAAERFLLPRGVHFVGVHPMAGTEKSGPDAAFAGLFENADVFIVPGAAPVGVVERVENFWRSVGTHTSRIDAAQHDRLVASTSHVLHVLASALASGILDAPTPEIQLARFRGCATGFRDTSRIASSNPKMWREIIENNRSAVLEALDDFDVYYKLLRSDIERSDFDAFERDFARGKELRDRWVEYKNQ